MVVIGLNNPFTLKRLKSGTLLDLTSESVGLMK